MKTNSATSPSVEGMFGLDFDSLAVGYEYEGAPRAIGERDVAVFAALTGDTHPIHLDAEWAANGPFGRPIAHGLLVLSCAVGSLPLDPERVLALRRLREVVFKRPLLVDDEIVVRCRVSELRAIDEGAGLVSCEWRIVGGDRKLRARATVEILWRRGKAGDRATRALNAAVPAGMQGPAADSALEELAPVEVTDDGSRVLI